MDYISDALPRSFLFALVFTVYAYFTDGVRFPFDPSVTLPPVWLHLLRIFVISFAVFFVGNLLFEFLKRKLGKNKDKF